MSEQAKKVGMGVLKKPTPVELLVNGYYHNPGYGRPQTGPRKGYPLKSDMGVFDPTNNQFTSLSDEKGVERRPTYLYPEAGEEVFSILPPVKAKRLLEGIEAVYKKNPSLKLQRFVGYNVGADPEIFVLDKEGGVIPAWTFLPEKAKAGTAQVYYDGPQAEFTTPAYTCLQQLCGTFQQRLTSILQAAKKVNKDARLSTVGVVEMPESILQDADLKYLELGCAPSLNAYGDVEAIHVPEPRSLPIRFAGSHMHFGIKRYLTKASHKTVVKTLDKMLGVMMVSLFEGLEDPRRRQFYGRPGEYREPAHGLEYRVPPSAMLAHPVLYYICYEIARQVLFCAKEGLDKYWKADDQQVKDIITFSDVREARRVLKKNQSFADALLTVPLRQYYGKGNPVLEKRLKKALAAINEGAHNHMNVEDVAGNWCLGTSQSPEFIYSWRV